MKPTNLHIPDSSQHTDTYQAHRDMAAKVFELNGYGANHRGDTKKAVELMVDIVRGEGVAAGKKFPRRLAVGAEAVTSLQRKCEEDLRMIKEWGEVMGSTDREGWKQVDGIEFACTPLPYDV